MAYFEYRSSILFYSLSSALWAIVSIFLQQYLFKEIQTFGGWTFGEFALLNGIYNFAFAFFLMFSWNSVNNDFRRAVKHGTLDSIITKPMPHRMMLTFARFDIPGFIHLIPASFILFYALSLATFNFTVFNVILSLVYFIIGQYVLNSIVYLFYASTFWLTSAEHISSTFWSIEGQSKLPLDILPKYLRFIFLTLIPIGFSAYIPTINLLGKLPVYFIVYTLIFVVVLEIINRAVWKLGLKRYESVSS
jgi:ABC-2 type transport system permease protein